MAETFSTFELAIGQQAPAFILPDPDGEMLSLNDIRGEQGTLVVFACNHCPYVIHLAKELGEMAVAFQEKGVETVVINSNDLENYPQDGPEEMKVFSEKYQWAFPYLLDESQEVAHAYGAACTPDFFLFDREMKLAYAGQFDDTRPKSGDRPTGDDLRNALMAVAKGEQPLKGKPASGCNIKWIPGNEPK